MYDLLDENSSSFASISGNKDFGTTTAFSMPTSRAMKTATRWLPQVKTIPKCWDYQSECLTERRSWFIAAAAAQKIRFTIVFALSVVQNCNLTAVELW